jgi:hypothetical protein
MLNVEQITSELARLPDGSLQRYAMMHKDDPYVMSLALSEANRRKELRAGAHMQAPQQPKVAEQALAGMAQQAPEQMPEAVGIGALPAPNMQHFDDGGIVGYGNGGNMDGYNPATGPAGRLAYNNEPVLRMADGGVVAFADEGLVQDDEPAWAQALAATERAQKARAAEKQAAQLKALQAIQATAPQARAAFATQDPRMAQVQQAVQARQQYEEQLNPTAPPTASGAAQAPQGGLPGLITSPAAAQAALAKMQAGVKPQVPEAVQAGISGLQQAQEAMASKNIEAIQQEQANRPLAFKDFETRLKAREERLTAQERDNGPLALLQAGLSIMGGRSPYALSNIGAGAQVGVKAYTDGAEKLQIARDKLDESFGRIEEVRRNESRMDAKELREARMAAMQPAIEAKKLTVSALEKDWGLKSQDATKAFEAVMQNQRSAFEQAGATARANAQVAATLSTPERQVFDALVKKHKGDPAAAYQELVASKREPMSMEKLRAEWLDPGKRAQIAQDYPNVKTFEDYLMVANPAGGGGGGGGFRLLGSRPAQ